MPKEDKKMTIDDSAFQDIEIEAMSAVHLEKTLFSACFELSDEEEEVARSYLLQIDFNDTLSFKVLLQVEDTIMSHISPRPDLHYALELGGIIHRVSPEGNEVTVVEEGFLRRIWDLNEKTLFLVGEDGVSYRSKGQKWLQLETFDDATITNIHGVSPEEIFAVGDSGLLLHLNGNGWLPVQLPFQDDLNAVWVSKNEGLFVGGRNGVCCQIFESELIELFSENLDYFAICEFKGERYWSSANYGLSIQKGNKIVPFRGLGQAFSMHATDSFLTIVGWKEVFIYDGQDWCGFELGYDGKIFLNQIDMARYDD